MDKIINTTTNSRFREYKCQKDTDDLKNNIELFKIDTSQYFSNKMRINKKIRVKL
jgi:hypothetical protein